MTSARFEGPAFLKSKRPSSKTPESTSKSQDIAVVYEHSWRRTAYEL